MPINDELLIVNENDEIIGYGEKMEIHKKRMLHRAFSIFIYDYRENRLLLQKRADSKYHSGGLWSNACCSHPRKNELISDSLSIRLKEELGLLRTFDVKNLDYLNCFNQSDDTILYCGKFLYRADFTELSEHEWDHVYLYIPKNDITMDLNINKEEASEIKWVKIDYLEKWLNEFPDDFSSWFLEAYKIVYQAFNRL